MSVPSDLADVGIGEGIEREAEEHIQSVVVKKQRQIDVCDMLELLAVGRPNFILIEKIAHNKASAVENMIIELELLCMGSCLNRECGKCEVFNFMHMFEAVDHIHIDIAPTSSLTAVPSPEHLDATLLQNIREQVTSLSPQASTSLKRPRVSSLCSVDPTLVPSLNSVDTEITEPERR